MFGEVYGGGDTATGRRLCSRIPQDCSHNWGNIWLCPALADGGLGRDPRGEIYIHCPESQTPQRDNGIGEGQETRDEKNFSMPDEQERKLIFGLQKKKVLKHDLFSFCCMGLNGFHGSIFCNSFKQSAINEELIYLFRAEWVCTIFGSAAPCTDCLIRGMKLF